MMGWFPFTSQKVLFLGEQTNLRTRKLWHWHEHPKKMSEFVALLSFSKENFSVCLHAPLVGETHGCCAPRMRYRKVALGVPGKVGIWGIMNIYNGAKVEDTPWKINMEPGKPSVPFF